MRRLDYAANPVDAFGRIHFVGIGGVGMSGIAEVLCNLGYKVSGSDLRESATTLRLAECGVEIHIGHEPDNVDGSDAVVFSSAVKLDNVELAAARAQRIPLVPRAEMLAELMRLKRGIAIAGTHGKTTTTSLIASVLSEGSLDPTYVIGGQLLAAGRHAALGSGDWLVAEADESDRSFLRLTPTMAVVTNIDPDHLENYDHDFANVVAAFDEFLHRLPFYGLAILCVDDEEVRALSAQTHRHVLTYGFADDAHIRASDVTQVAGQTTFTMQLPAAAPIVVELNLPGRHNVQNALAAAAVGWQLGVQPEAIARALEAFQGIGRRFNQLGEVNFGAARALVIDDYGHHPRELDAVFAAARAGWPDRRLVVVFQPHRFTRTRDMLDDFAAVLSSADGLILTEVYAAGEAPIPGADGRSLIRAVRARGQVDPVFIADPEGIPDALPALIADGDLLLFAGAGDIGAVAPRVVQIYGGQS